MPQSAADLILPLPGEDRHQRRVVFDAAVFEHLPIARHPRTAPNGVIDGHPGGDGANPAAEAARIFKLIELPHGLDKHVLANFLRFGMVAQPAEDRGIDRLLVIFDQAAERLPVAALRSANRLGRRVFDRPKQSKPVRRSGFRFRRQKGYR